MKNKIVVEKYQDEMKFYLKNDKGTFWLFSQPYTKGVYNWFRDGRSENEIIRFSKWKKNKRLNNTINRIPREIRYVSKYIINDDEKTA
ncbi:MAG: hypothetical protein ACI4W6_07565 [Acutalibacteraceae bacterium]